jgi:hypothetical protein
MTLLTDWPSSIISPLISWMIAYIDGLQFHNDSSILIYDQDRPIMTEVTSYLTTIARISLVEKQYLQATACWVNNCLFFIIEIDV